MNHFKLRHAALAGLIAMCVSGTALATDSTSGLGQAWPNAPDVSASPHWHVYKFVKDGVEYIQINDLNGTVRAAFGTAGGQFLVLPMGRSALSVVSSAVTSTASTLLSSASASSETVYHDDNVTVLAVPQSDGTTSFQTAAATTGECPDQSDCNLHTN